MARAQGGAAALRASCFARARSSRSSWAATRTAAWPGPPSAGSKSWSPSSRGRLHPTASTVDVDSRGLLPSTDAARRHFADGPCAGAVRRDGFHPHDRDLRTRHDDADVATFVVTIGAVGPPGPAGPQGPIGAPGPVGPQGPIGATGTQGPQGLTGPQGPKGDAGATGAIGPMGATGPVGPTGAIGPQGDKGDRGDIGATGAQGPQGVPGPQGPVGQGLAHWVASAVNADGTSQAPSASYTVTKDAGSATYHLRSVDVNSLGCLRKTRPKNHSPELAVRGIAGGSLLAASVAAQVLARVFLVKSKRSSPRGSIRA